MELDWMMLANHAEAPPGSGLVYISGGGFDTITVAGPPPPEAPPELVTLMQGNLVVRLLFHKTELDRERHLEITFVDEDGTDFAKIDGGFNPASSEEVPPSWMHGYNLVFPVTGVPITRFGLFAIHVTLDGTHVGEQKFRVVKAY